MPLFNQESLYRFKRDLVCMFERLNRHQFRTLVFLLAKAELQGFSVFKKYPAYGTILQDVDVYAECVNNKKIVKKVFIDCEDTDWMTTELMDAEVTYRDDLVKKGFMLPGRDVFWVVVPTRFDVSCLSYTKLENFEMKDFSWLIKSIRRYFPHYKELRQFIQTLQSAKLLPSPI